MASFCVTVSSDDILSRNAAEFSAWGRGAFSSATVSCEAPQPLNIAAETNTAINK
jgi:hypothetical protein